jgi:hypothetical protein
MDFIDKTGHIFSLDEYASYPEGYLYNENKYVFWMESNYTDLSVQLVVHSRKLFPFQNPS